MRSLISELPTKYYSSDQIQTEMCGACTIYGEKEGCTQGFDEET
jgi:hypothetical protein